MHVSAASGLLLIYSSPARPLSATCSHPTLNVCTVAQYRHMQIHALPTKLFFRNLSQDDRNVGKAKHVHTWPHTCSQASAREVHVAHGRSDRQGLSIARVRLKSSSLSRGARGASSITSQVRCGGGTWGHSGMASRQDRSPCVACAINDEVIGGEQGALSLIKSV